MNTGFATIPGGAATVLAVAAATAAADPFDKSPQNPLNMSRAVAPSTAASPAPSSKLLDRVRAAAADLAELACAQAGWRYVTEKNNTSVYELSGAVLPPAVRVAGNAGDYYLVKGVTSVRASADRVLAMLAATDDFALRMNQLFGRAYHNGVLIDHMSCTAPPARFQSEDGSVLSFTQDDAYSVNWLSLKPPSTSDNFRDFTFASYQDAFHRDARGALVRLGRSAVRDPLLASAVNPLASSGVNPLAASSSGRRADGRVLGVHVLSSFNFKDIPELPRTKYTDRFHLRTSGFVVEETHEPGVVRVSFFLSLTPVAATLRNPRKYEKWLQTLALSVGNLALQLETPAPTPESDRIRWKHSDHCALCVKSFHTFRRCHHCRFCGESVCNKCSGFVDSSRVPAVRAAAAHDVYTEVRGCKRCIRHLMDEMANGIADRTSASSHSSNGSGRHAKRASSFMNDYRQPSPLVVHHYEDDDQSSMESSSTDGYSTNYTRPQHRQQGHRSASIPVMRPHSDDSLTMDDLRAPSTRLSKPPRDPKTSLSISSASTSQSFDDRVSGGSHKVATVTVSPDFFASRYEDDEDDERYEPLAASAIHANNSSRFDGDDVVDVDVDDLVSQFARSMVSVKAAANASSSDVYSEKMANANAFLQRQTTSSTSSSNSSFKFSLMSNSHLDVLEGNNHHDDAGRHHGPRYSPPRPVSSKLFSISSSGTRQSRPPRPQPAVVDRSRSSSNASQRANEELMMMVPLSTAAPKKTKNDMILLTPVAPVVPQFVEFSDSYRESMDVRPRDVGEMIPLRF